jgi:two-component system, response regulator
VGRSRARTRRLLPLYAALPGRRGKASGNERISVKRILLVEDREDDIVLALRVIRKILGECDIAVARNGEEALALLFNGHSDPFDLVFLDIQLPGVDGLSILGRIREDARLAKQPVIMLTTSSNNEDVAKADSLGADYYFVKPLGFREFEAEMAAVLKMFL